MADKTVQGEQPIHITYDDEKHKYTLDGQPVPGVTEILDRTTPKDALPWWGMRVGMAAVIHMLSLPGKAGTLGWADLAIANEPKEIIEGKPAPGREHFGARDKKRAKPKTLVEKEAIERQITTNHIKDEAADRGTSIHVALEAVGNDVMPDVEQFPEEHRGYVAAVMRWWLDQQPEFLEQEIIVGSRQWMYAGRFDMVVRFHAGAYKGEICLVDLKTSKDIYQSHLEQLVAYEIGYTEMRLLPPGLTDAEEAWLRRRQERDGRTFDRKLVLHADRDGNYRMVESVAEPRVFTAAVELFYARKRVCDAHPGVRG